MSTINVKEGVLLVSSPRSGSTLVSNIIRSHSSVIYMNELLTRSASLLPGFERKFNAKESFDNVLKDEFEKLYLYTLPFSNHVVYRNKFFSYGINLGCKFLNNILPKKIRNNFKNPLYKFWYINSLQEKPFRFLWQTTFVKKNPQIIFLKDVQVQKSLQAFKSLYPNGRVIFLIRHPYGFFTSTMKSRGFPSAETIPICKDDLIEMFDKKELVNSLYDDSVIAKFMLAYRLHNEFALVFLAQNFPKENVLFVRYEDFISDKFKYAQQIFDFLQIKPDHQSARFLNHLEEFKGVQQHVRSVFKSTSDWWDQKVLDRYNIEDVNKFMKGSEILSIFNYTLNQV